jgi:hypothetical protein
MNGYAIILDVDAPPALVAYEGFAGLKKQLGIDMAEVACRPTIADFRVIMLVDEDGLLKDGPKYNALATAITAYANWHNEIVGPAAILGDDGEDICGLTAEQAQEVVKLLDVLQGKDKDCIVCGFTSLDGVWYDGTCEDCHNEAMEKSIYEALKSKEVGNETVQG